MVRYEYKVISTDAKGFLGGKVNIDDYQAQINALGDEGWELTQTFASNQDAGGTRYIISIFKRARGL